MNLKQILKTIRWERILLLILTAVILFLIISSMRNKVITDRENLKAENFNKGFNIAIAQMVLGSRNCNVITLKYLNMSVNLQEKGCQNVE